MPTVFISHSHADKPIVRFLWHDLLQCGVSVWIDEGETQPGDSLTQQIGAALDDVDAVAGMLSPDAIRSRWVCKEINAAIARSVDTGRPVVIPVLLPGFSPTAVPALLADTFQVRLAEPRDYDTQVCSLASAVSTSSSGDKLDPCRLPMTANRRERIVEIADRSPMREWAVQYLKHKLSTEDPTERYWVYIALAQIGGAEPTSIVEAGLDDPNEFARRGAEDAVRLFGDEDPPGPCSTNEGEDQ